MYDHRITIGFPHCAPSTGGPGTFQSALQLELEKQGYEIIYPEDKAIPDVIIIVGGTRRLIWLWRCKKNGAKIVHRLDGINWRYKNVGTPLNVRLIQQFRNFLMAFIRNHLADVVIYQSSFIKRWWHREYGTAPVQEKIIYNSTDLSIFNDNNRPTRTGSAPTLLCVEGNLQLDSGTFKVIRHISKGLVEKGLLKEILIAGNIAAKDRRLLDSLPGVKLLGSVPREQMPGVYAKGDIFLSLDINAACPNAVIEAMASRIPIVGFDTGSLKELVGAEAGIIVPYGGDPWKLEEPNYQRLCSAIEYVARNQAVFSRAARNTAEEKYGLDSMVSQYLQSIEKVV